MADDAIEVELLDDPRAFLELAGEHLAADPVESTVVAAFTRRAADGEPHRGDGPRWWAVVRKRLRRSGLSWWVSFQCVHECPDEGAVAEPRRLRRRRSGACWGGSRPTSACSRDL